MSKDKIEGRNRRQFEDITKEIKETVLKAAEEIKFILEKEISGLNELRFLARKFVERTYIRKTGLNIPKWIRTFNKLIHQFQNNDFIEYFNSRIWLSKHLRRLETHFQEKNIDSKSYKQNTAKSTLSHVDINKVIASVRELIQALGLDINT